MNKNEENTKNQRTNKPEASNEKVNGDMASEWEELVELDDVQLATVVGGARPKEPTSKEKHCALLGGIIVRGKCVPPRNGSDREKIEWINSR
jgi:hypothetical protein